MALAGEGRPRGTDGTLFHHQYPLFVEDVTCGFGRIRGDNEFYAGKARRRSTREPLLALCDAVVMPVRCVRNAAQWDADLSQASHSRSIHRLDAIFWQ